MQGFDGRGPQGAGSMTGRGMGYCNPNANAGLAKGRGFGRGFGGQAVNPAYQNQSYDEASELNADTDSLKATLQQINSRLDELEKKV